MVRYKCKKITLHFILERGVSMLSKLVIKNYKSFSKETIIDAKATNYRMLRENVTKSGILKSIMFIGGNATGKTNTIKAIKLLLDLLLAERDVDLGPKKCLFCPDKDTKLSYYFEFDNNIINYLIEIDSKNEIAKEKLMLNDKEMFVRLGLNAESHITEKAKYNNKDIDKDSLFLKTIYFNTKFKGYPVLEKWFKFLMNSVYFNAVDKTAKNYSSIDNLSLRKYLDNEGVKKINEFFDYFGFNQKITYTDEHFISKFAHAKIENQKEVFFKKNDMDLWIPINLESLGNQTLINMLPALLHITKNPGMLLLDEFSSAFHNELEELIVRYFMNNSNQSQMFFVSHSTNLLKTTLLRPDQIYTFSFRDHNGTQIKRVSSEGPRESQNIEKMYLSGVFNGVPEYKRKVK